jgi:adenylate cyclase class 2
MGDGLETEVKFAAQTLVPVRERLLAAGAELVQPRTFELNLRLDDAQGGMLATGKVLRLRRDSSAWLTLKLPVGPWGTQAKTLRELEVELNDFDIAREILAELGFHTWFTYEKYRESYHLTGTEISLDELPFGSFVEIEGSLEAIREVTPLLGLAEAQPITSGYFMLFQEAKQRLGLPFDDCTFANWRRLREGESV